MRDEELASLAWARPRMSVNLCLGYSGLALGQDTLWTLSASMTGSILADLAREPLRPEPDLVRASECEDLGAPRLPGCCGRNSRWLTGLSLATWRGV